MATKSGADADVLGRFSLLYIRTDMVERGGITTRERAREREKEREREPTNHTSSTNQQLSRTARPDTEATGFGNTR